ncbi:hypothetical protein EXIGLDRAFT_56126 [Exidia glandulosa HHB12029]|uniref:Uncharacterized protein n=1 Tax=Exidia glandulosa HHB12029 TaxID=1314781 RepID=A0A166MNN2_EXIGL|nr:hypothetical protein EXIGLDRAFT_56126 [Exidia glandulosa HHB12029]
MRGVSELTPPGPAAVAPPRPHAFQNIEATPMHGAPANRTDMTPMAVAVTSPLIIPTGSQHSSSHIFETSSIRNEDSTGIPTKRHESHDEMDDPFAKRPRVSSEVAPSTSLASHTSPPPASLITGFT